VNSVKPGSPLSRVINVTRRLRQVLNMTPEQYVESTRPRVDDPENPWIRPDSARIAQLEAVKTISHNLCLALEGLGIETE